MMSVLADLLRKQPYFEECSQTTIDLLAVQALHRQFASGEAIFHEGDPAIGLWLIETGSIKIFKVNPDGIEHILHLLGAGSTFNDIAALDGGTNPANAAALSETSV
nr:cyclic nucleotide-binding domain-containing protein [Anaerolineae bacterium]